MTKEEFNIVKIDAVILWVDGNDEAYKSKISPYLKEDQNSTKSFNNRYIQVDEIEYTVHSILKYASFINTVFIVTDNQTPEFLKHENLGDKYANVKIVNHTSIFKGLETNLPTFNSRTIESCIHRIPELSEHFIYLNDDFFIINPTTKADFFTENGFPILRGFWQQFEADKFYKKEKTEKASHKAAQEKAAKILGFKKLFRFKHTPHPMRKSTLEAFFNENPEVFLENIKYKFRNRSQFLPVALANHLEIKYKTCKIQKDLQLLYFRSYKKPLYWYKFKLNINSKNKLFLGLQSLNKSPKNILNFIVSWLKQRTL
ncbi:Stealth CR1 domain-containing protein [Winogradskyella echinorum]|uniref:Stealth CR1 domain-containing protein n=1 Tax=Winogradskyella echinorum TaxID=538189 RepID=A0ABR6Y3D1_9FLAO|nr:Stealth CR1 domain-containing protein [Winogradskyella echinorum]MBC3847246.1 Stealth CR1 domain-containing protein [Winogradskyella echinorum]MBC5751594.1 Stealth CR1 domain-containing protein [Winogradskyella echinorum]